MINLWLFSQITSTESSFEIKMLFNLDWLLKYSCQNGLGWKRGCSVWLDPSECGRCFCWQRFLLSLCLHGFSRPFTLKCTFVLPIYSFLCHPLALHVPKLQYRTGLSSLVTEKAWDNHHRPDKHVRNTKFKPLQKSRKLFLVISLAPKFTTLSWNYKDLTTTFY